MIVSSAAPRRPLRRRHLPALAALAVVVALPAAAQRRHPLDDAAILAALNPADPQDRAILEARDEVSREPASVAAHIRLGNAYLAGAWLIEAQEAYRKATDVDPESAAAWNNLGVVQELSGDVGRARQSFARAVQVDPRNGDAQYNLGATHERANQFDAAVLHYRQALLVRPELGNPAVNPKALHAAYLLPARLSVYLETNGGRTLPPLGPDGSSAIGAVPPPGVVFAPPPVAPAAPAAIPATPAAPNPVPSTYAPFLPPAAVAPPAPGHAPAPAVVPAPAATPPLRREAPLPPTPRGED